MQFIVGILQAVNNYGYEANWWLSTEFMNAIRSILLTINANLDINLLVVFNSFYDSIQKFI